MGRIDIGDYVVRRIERAIAVHAPEDDAYVYSFEVRYDDNDPRLPTVWFGWNTEAQVQATLEHRTSDEVEARWNYAHWLQNEIALIGGHGDADGATRFRAWLQHDVGRWYSDEEEADDFDATLEVGEEMTEAFWHTCVDVVAALHQRGRTLGPRGRLIPIIVHELEYHDETIEANERVNPAGLVPDGFYAFCRGD